MLTNRPVIINKQENRQYFVLFILSFYFDGIFGARDTVNLPYAKEADVASSHHISDAASGEATPSTNEGLILFNFYLG